MKREAFVPRQLNRPRERERGRDPLPRRTSNPKGLRPTDLSALETHRRVRKNRCEILLKYVNYFKRGARERARSRAKCHMPQTGPNMTVVRGRVWSGLEDGCVPVNDTQRLVERESGVEAA